MCLDIFKISISWCLLMSMGEWNLWKVFWTLIVYVYPTRPSTFRYEIAIWTHSKGKNILHQECVRLLEQTLSRFCPITIGFNGGNFFKTNYIYNPTLKNTLFIGTNKVCGGTKSRIPDTSASRPLSFNRDWKSQISIEPGFCRSKIKDDF